MAVATEWTVHHACGHDQVRDLSNVPVSERARRATSMEKWDCTDCWHDKRSEKWRDEHHEEIGPTIVAWETQVGMPALEGSERQVAWASRIRFELLSAAFDLPLEGVFYAKFVDDALQVRNASWWIDQRNASVEDIEELVADAVLQASVKTRKS